MKDLVTICRINCKCINFYNGGRYMEKLYKNIRHLTNLYLSEDIIEKIIKSISGIKDDIKKSYYQITQTNDKVRFEFACHAGNYIYDLTATNDEVNIYYMNISAIPVINTKEETGSYKLSFELGNNGFSYTATNEKSIVNLKEFSSHITNQVIGGWSNVG
jgi:hypothetical protein